MKKFSLNNIDTEFRSYQQLINLYNQNKDNLFETIELSFEKWFAANLCSPLGAVMDKLISETITLSFGNIPGNIKSIIQKNDFLSHYGYNRLIDFNDTTIKYMKLKPTDGRYFNNYLITELLNRSELPKFSNALKKKIAESIYEVFVNAQIHSESPTIYTCGQYFPQKNSIELTITDIGVGFKYRVNKRFNSELSSIQAIKWAINDGSSTKREVSGGIGLAILKEFIIKNGGKIQIISDDGFYQLDQTSEKTAQFSGAFPGTIVNMQFKTDDSSSYVLSKEINPKDIF